MEYTRQATSRCWLLPLLVLAAAAPAPAADLRLSCQPLYAQQDFRAIRPDYVRGMAASSTWYLFDSRDLLHFRVELVNDGPQPIELGNLDWPAELGLELSRDGQALPAEAFRADLLRRVQLDHVYLLDGQPLERVDFVRRTGGPGSEPVQEFDDWRREIRSIDRLPSRLETYQQAGVELALTAADGEPLAPGVYRLTFRDKKTGLACDGGPQQLVLRRPESELDRVEGRLARYRYLEAAGDRAAALEELRRACSENPESLTAWYYLAGQAGQAGELELQLEAVEKLSQLLYERSPKLLADSTSVLELAPEAVRQLEELRREVRQAREPEKKL